MSLDRNERTSAKHEMKRQRNMTGKAARAEMPGPESWKAKCKIQNQHTNENHAVGTCTWYTMQRRSRFGATSGVSQSACLQREVVANQQSIGLRFMKLDRL